MAKVKDDERQLARRLDRDRARLERIGVAEASRIGFRAQREAAAAVRRGGDPRPAFRRALARAVPILTQGMVLAHLTGRLRAISLAEPKARGLALKHAPFANTAYLGALNAMAARLHLTTDQLDQLVDRHQAAALRVIKGAADHVEKRLQAALFKITARGLHRREAVKELSLAFDRLGLTPENSFTLEAIFRTQTAQAYGAGRWQLDRDPAVQEILWGYKYVTVGDDRVRPEHVGLDGVTLPKDHGFWKVHWPPNGWCCRCQAIPIFDSAEPVEPPDEVEVDGKPVKPGADKGFRVNSGILFQDAVLPKAGAAPAVPAGSIRPAAKAGALADVPVADLAKAPIAPSGPVALDEPANAPKPVEREPYDLDDDRPTAVPYGTEPFPAPEPKKPARPAKPRPSRKGIPAGFPTSPDKLVEVRVLGGYTKARLVRDPRTGKEFVLKRGSNPAHVAEENLANRLYAALGVKVPKAHLYETPDGPVQLTEYLAGARDIREVIRGGDPAAAALAVTEANKGFVADALLANWDVAGPKLDNLMVAPDGTVYRIDAGGALRMKGIGQPKPPGAFGAEVRELETLRDPAVNRETAQVFATITDQEILDQIRAVRKRRARLLAAVPDDLKPTIEARLDYLDRYGKQLQAKIATAGKITRPGRLFNPSLLKPPRELPPQSYNRDQVVKSAGLTGEERRAVRWYTGSGYRDANRRLNLVQPITPEQVELCKHLDSALAKAKVYKSPTHRTLFFNEENLRKFMAQHQPGDVVCYNAYTSTSRATDVFGFDRPGEYDVRLFVEKSITGRSIEDWSGIHGELEVLYGRGTQFYVKEVKQRPGQAGYDVYVEEI